MLKLNIYDPDIQVRISLPLKKTIYYRCSKNNIRFLSPRIQDVKSVWKEINKQNIFLIKMVDFFVMIFFLSKFFCHHKNSVFFFVNKKIAYLIYQKDFILNFFFVNIFLKLFWTDILRTNTRSHELGPTGLTTVHLNNVMTPSPKK